MSLSLVVILVSTGSSDFLSFVTYGQKAEEGGGHTPEEEVLE